MFLGAFLVGLFNAIRPSEVESKAWQQNIFSTMLLHFHALPTSKKPVFNLFLLRAIDN